MTSLSALASMYLKQRSVTRELTKTKMFIKLVNTPNMQISGKIDRMTWLVVSSRHTVLLKDTHEGPARWLYSWILVRIESSILLYHSFRICVCVFFIIVSNLWITQPKKYFVCDLITTLCYWKIDVFLFMNRKYVLKIDLQFMI